LRLRGKKKTYTERRVPGEFAGSRARSASALSALFLFKEGLRRSKNSAYRALSARARPQLAPPGFRSSATVGLAPPIRPSCIRLKSVPP